MAEPEVATLAVESVDFDVDRPAQAPFYDEPTRPEVARGAAREEDAGPERENGQSEWPAGGEQDDSSLIGQVLAKRYYVTGELGAGGMGSVYRVEHVDLRKSFALKMLRAELQSSRSTKERFLQEARTASLIRHPNVVEISDFGYASGSPFFVMEYLEGEELAAVIKREGPLPWPRVRDIMLQILAALEAAHAHGVIHRDMKPSNCFCALQGNGETIVKVLDFGIAKLLDDDDDAVVRTRTGALVGTPQYMSPEQANSDALDVRTDVYSAGVVAFQLLTGRLPYEAKGVLRVLSKVQRGELPTMRSVAPEVVIDHRVETVVRRAMARDRERRYASAAAFAQALRSLPTTLLTTRRRSLQVTLMGGLALLVALSLITWAVSARSPEGSPSSPLVAGATSSITPETKKTSSSVAEEVPAKPLDAEGRGLVPAPVKPPEPAPEPETPVIAPETPAGHERPSRPRRVNSTRGRASTRAAEPPDLPRSPSDAAINRALAALKPSTRACVQNNTTYLDSMTVALAVDPSGRVTKARTRGLNRGTPIATCIERALKLLAFPKSVRGFEQTVTIKLQQ